MELRWNQWIARREVEGPKKINQVHADARRDDANRARAAAGGPNMRGRGDFNRGPSNMDAYGGPPQRCRLLLVTVSLCRCVLCFPRSAVQCSLHKAAPALTPVLQLCLFLHVVLSLIVPRSSCSISLLHR